MEATTPVPTESFEGVSTLSRDVRTPLNSVLGFMDLVLDGELDSSQRELIEIARRSGLEIRDRIAALASSDDAVIDRVNATTTEKTTPADSTPTTGTTPSLTPKVLVVEDDPVNRQLVAHMLDRLGQTADYAHDGFDGARLAAECEYDLILMDVNMPVMNGIDATEAIRSSIAWHRQPVIVAVTANAFDADRATCLRSGMDDVATKPLGKVDLERIIDRVAESHRPSRMRGLHARPPDVEVIDLDVLDDSAGGSVIADLLIEIAVPTVIESVQRVIVWLDEVLVDDGRNDQLVERLLEGAATARRHAEGLFAERLTWVLGQLIEEARRADWIAATSVSEHLVDEFLALEAWKLAWRPRPVPPGGGEVRPSPSSLPDHS